MKIIYSEQALSDLAAIHEYQKREWPGVGEKFDERLVEIEQRILTFPTGAAVVENRPGVFVVPFLRYPYRLFYALNGEDAVILHIRNTSRKPWADD